MLTAWRNDVLAIRFNRNLNFFRKIQLKLFLYGFTWKPVHIFLAWIAHYYRVIFWNFWHIISVILSICSFFFTYFLCHFTQITPYYRPLFRVLRPILTVILRVFLDPFRYFSALIWSIFSIFWTYIKCDFHFFPCKT